MKILLPPSEGKTAPREGASLKLEALSLPQLAHPRRAVIDELVSVSRRPDALEILGVGARIRHEVLAQRELESLPCAPARSIYTGVLYEAAGLRHGDDVWIFSGLFGVTHAEDLIPAYRLSMAAHLPSVGSLKSFWKNALSSISWDDDVFVDMRSGAYQVWNPPGTWWQVRVVDGAGKVVSHMAKRYRGLLARALLNAHSDDVASVAATIGRVSVAQKGRRRLLTLEAPDLSGATRGA